MVVEILECTDPTYDLDSLFIDAGAGLFAYDAYGNKIGLRNPTYSNSTTSNLQVGISVSVSFTDDYWFDVDEAGHYVGGCGVLGIKRGTGTIKIEVPVFKGSIPSWL